MRVASTAVSIVPWPDIITTGIVSCPLADHSFSSVMPSVSGIQMSSSTRSGRAALRAVRAAEAFSASTMSCPSSLSISKSSSRMPTSSSTMSMFAMGHLSLVRGCEPQADADFGAPGVSVHQADFSTMFVDDLLHHREAEARPTALRREVRLERMGQHGRRETRAVVPYQQRNAVPFRARDERHDALVLFGQRIFGILEQIVDDLPQLGRVARHRRQAALEFGTHAH